MPLKSPKPDWSARLFQSKCSQCKKNKATGSARMTEGNWVKVCDSCRRAMGVKGKKGQKA